MRRNAYLASLLIENRRDMAPKFHAIRNHTRSQNEYGRFTQTLGLQLKFVDISNDVFVSFQYI
jgi:hypothetical protein